MAEFAVRKALSHEQPWREYRWSSFLDPAQAAKAAE
jgi:hypothetical protein